MALSLFANDFFSDPFDELVFATVAPRQVANRNVLTRGQREIRCNFEEHQSAYMLTADLPGLKREEIKVDIDGDVITLGLESKKDADQAPEEGVTYHRMERSQHYKSRAMRLPDNADTGKIDAKFENGVLSITIPKKTKEETTKRITIA